MKTTKMSLLRALETGTLTLMDGSKLANVARIEREDGSGQSFNVYTGERGYYVRTVD